MQSAFKVNLMLTILGLKYYHLKRDHKLINKKWSKMKNK